MTNRTEDPLYYFFDRFAEASGLECAVFKSTTWTYRDLLEEISRDSQALAEYGISVGHVVGITGQFHLRHLSLFFALARAGATIVPLPGIEELEANERAEIANATHLVRVTQEGHWALRATGSVVSHHLLTRLLERREGGLIVFSSGSAGGKKAILHSMPKLLGKFQMRRKGYRTLAFLKLDHLGGINTLLHALSNSGMIVFPRNRGVDDICKLIQDYTIQLLPVTPTFLKLLLLSGSYLLYNLASLRLITYGTEVMPEQALKQLCEAFPACKFQQTYGLSELGVFRSKSRASDSLWVKVGGESYETRVIGETLWVRSRCAMEGYLNYESPFLEGGWFNTGDRVEVDGEFVRFLGRESDMINVGGEKVSPIEVENFLLHLTDVKDVIVSAEPNLLLGNIVVAQIVLATNVPDADALRRIRMACHRGLPRFMVPARIYFVSHLEYSDRYKRVRGVL